MSVDQRRDTGAASDTLLAVDDLKVHFRVPLGGYPWSPKGTLRAVDGVSFDVKRGETVGLVGESGCGKSTLARALIGLVPTTAGTVRWRGEAVAPERLRGSAMRREVQMIFQDPLASLDPRMTIEQIVAEPLVTHHAGIGRTEVRRRVVAMLERVGLNAHHLLRYPHEFSGGQCQRVGIARALIGEPKLVICDEPVSALDVSIQAQILNLFMDLQEQFKTSYVFISHNLSVVEHVADDVMVMYFGSVAELGDKATIYARPRHPYTRALMSATPAIFEEDRRVQIKLQGELPSPLNPPSGCAFHQRCPYAIERCRAEEPQLRDVDGRLVACHRAEEVGEANA